MARGDSTRLSPAISLGKVMEEGRGRRRKRRGSGKSSMVGLPVYCADKIQTRQNIIPTVEKHAGILSPIFLVCGGFPCPSRVWNESRGRRRKKGVCGGGRPSSELDVRG